MNKTEKNLIAGILVNVIAGIIMLLSSCSKPVNEHGCIWSLCPYKYEVDFSHGCGYCDDESECYQLDSLHFFNPALDYDQLEDKLFNQDKK